MELERAFLLLSLMFLPHIPLGLLLFFLFSGFLLLILPATFSRFFSLWIYEMGSLLYMEKFKRAPSSTYASCSYCVGGMKGGLNIVDIR